MNFLSKLSPVDEAKALISKGNPGLKRLVLGLFQHTLKLQIPELRWQMEGIICDTSTLKNSSVGESTHTLDQKILMSELFAGVVSSKFATDMVWKKLFQVSFLTSEEKEEKNVDVVHITPKKAFHLSFCKIWKCSGKTEEIWAVLELLPSLTVTQLAEMSSWLPAATAPEKDVSFTLPFKDVRSSRTQTNKPFHNTLVIPQLHLYMRKSLLNSFVRVLLTYQEHTVQESFVQRTKFYKHLTKMGVYTATKHQAS